MNPPRLPQAILRAILPPDDAETIAGDLEETFHMTSAQAGAVAAAWWYWRQVFSICSARLFGRGGAIDSAQSPHRRITMSTIKQDLQYGLRSLRKRPGFTANAVLMLGLGLGANVAIFSLVNAVLFKRLPFSDPADLMLVHMLAPDRESPGTYRQVIWSYPKYQMFREHQQVFESTGAFAAWTWNVSGSGIPEQAAGELVEATYFHTLGVAPQLGRTFAPEEARGTDSVRLAIIADPMWRDRFGRAGDVIGRVINLNGDPHTVVGVMPPGFRGLTGQASIWVPLTTLPADALGEKWNHSYTVVGRLKNGVSYGQADAATRTLGTAIDHQFPNPTSGSGGWGATAVPLNDERADPLIRRSALLLFGAVAAVLLLVCINLANLMLVRVLGRQREVAIRLALGATRTGIIRLLMTESLLLALMSAVVGLALAFVLVSIGASLMPDLRVVLTARGQSTGLTRVGLSALSLDAGVLVFTGFIAVLAALLFGLAPAWRASRPDLCEAMKAGSSGSVSPGTRGAGVRNVLAVGEIAIALILLTAAGLLTKSVVRLQSTELGFEPAGLIAVRVGLHRPSPDGLKGSQFFERFVERLSARPEVSAVAFGSCPPVSGACNATTAKFPDRPPVAKGSDPPVGVLWASPQYFETLGIRVVKGRTFTTDDRVGQPKVVVINQTAARQFWGPEDPIGKRIAVGQGGFGDGAEVVGVVADVRYGQVETSVKPDVYLPLLQSVRVSGYLFVRGRASFEVLLPAIRAELQAMHPELPLADVRTMEERFADATWRTRMSAWLLGAFAALGLLLAALGVYGVMAQGVEQRTREIGVRLALGAARGDILRLIIGRVFAIALTGIGAGILLAIPAARMLTVLLYEVEPGDPLVLATLASLLLAVALLAGYLPARRATQVDALMTLRTE